MAVLVTPAFPTVRWPPAALSEQAWRRSSHLHESQAGQCAFVIEAVPGVHKPAGLASALSVSERPCLRNLGGRQLRKMPDISLQPPHVDVLITTHPKHAKKWDSVVL